MEPKVTVLLAIYNPNILWLSELLKSLDNQTYSNYDVLAIDDNSNKVDFLEIKKRFEENLKHIKYKILRNEENLGSNTTFGKLVSLAKSDYVCFCDQDDIWHTNKISESIRTLLREQKIMTCSDVQTMDENGKILSKSITKYKKRFKLYDTNQFTHLVFKNFVIGCTICCQTDFAKSNLPFNSAFVHDHQLALEASYKNELVVIHRSLLDYRIHEKNQTNTLKQVNDRKSYFDYKINGFKVQIDFMVKKYNKQELDIAKKWSDARINSYYKEKGSWMNLFHQRNVCKSVSYFELFALRNKVLFYIATRLLKDNKI